VSFKVKFPLSHKLSLTLIEMMKFIYFISLSLSFTHFFSSIAKQDAEMALSMTRETLLVH
jgi:competence protein ComGC